MKNLYVVAMLAAALAGGTLESASAQSAAKTGIKNVVLVHGGSESHCRREGACGRWPEGDVFHQ